MLESRKGRFQHCFQGLTQIPFKDKKNSFSGLDCRLFVISSSSFNTVLLLLFHISIRIEQICLCQLLQVVSDSVISDCLSSFCLQTLEFALVAFKCMHLSTVTSEILDLGMTYSEQRNLQNRIVKPVGSVLKLNIEITVFFSQSLRI